MSQNEEIQKLIDSGATLIHEGFTGLMSANQVEVLAKGGSGLLTSNSTPPPPPPPPPQSQTEGADSNE